MNIQEYITEQLASGRTMEDIMKEMTASANAAEKAYEASKVKVKDYTKPLNFDNEVLCAIRDNKLSAETVADVFLYWMGSISSEFITILTPKELDTLRSELVKELDTAVNYIGRISNIMNDEAKNDWDKLMALTADLLDSKLTGAKVKIKTDSDKIAESMRKLGF